MTSDRPGTIVVCGATGRQGGAVARHLLADGWPVRGLTRNPDSAKARALAAAGADIVRADMSKRAELDHAFSGAYGVFNVQNPMISGEAGEIAQGRNVGDAAEAAGVRHLVYGSAGPGPRTGVPSWDAKIDVADHFRGLGLPLTILRPMAFMELMTDKDLYPQVAMWHLMPKLVGRERALPWLAADDLGAIAAKAFGDPARYVDSDIPLASDVRTLAECHAAWTEAHGRAPRGFPMPIWLFKRFTGDDLLLMWRWLRTGDVPEDTAPTRAIHPDATTVRGWLERRGEAAVRR